MMRIWPRKAGGETTRGTSGTRSGGGSTTGPPGGGGWPPSERQSRYCKSGSLDSRYGSRTGLGPHMMGPLTSLHLGPNPWHEVQPAHQPSKLTINPKGNIIEIRSPSDVQILLSLTIQKRKDTSRNSTIAINHRNHNQICQLAIFQQ